MRVVRRVHDLVQVAACRRGYVRDGRRWSWTPGHLGMPVAPWTMAMARGAERPLMGDAVWAQCAVPVEAQAAVEATATG